MRADVRARPTGTLDRGKKQSSDRVWVERGRCDARSGGPARELDVIKAAGEKCGLEGLVGIG